MNKMLPFFFLLLLNSSPTTGMTKLSHQNICQLLVQTNGYICEEHKAKTEDGYILSLIRIPMGRTGAHKTGVKPPVLLQHGLMADASTWLSNSPVQSLGFILADKGYDVWMSNVRGTNYSRGHVSLSIDDQDYWNWSWDELVAYDLPTFFHYIYQNTGQKLHYVGHSLGTLMALGAFSKGEVLSMVRSAVLLCPIAYLGWMPSPIARAAADVFIGEDLYWLGLKEFSPTGGPLQQLVNDICNLVNCDNLPSVFTGTNCCLNTSKPALTLLQPTATKNMIHLAQMIRKGKFAMFDYENIVDNIIHYGQPIPPDYELSNIPEELPIFLSYGGKDLLADVKDVETLIISLSDHDQNKLVSQYIPNYAHLDFVLGLNANVLVYTYVIDFFTQN